MKIVRSELVGISNNNQTTIVDLKINNGRMNFSVVIEKENMKFEDIINNNVDVRVILLTRNCCTAFSTLVLESGRNTEEDEEICEMLSRIIELIGNEIKEKLM